MIQKNKFCAEYFPKTLHGQKQPPEAFCKKIGALKNLQNAQENTCARVSFLITLQSFTFFTEHLRKTVSAWKLALLTFIF